MKISHQKWQLVQENERRAWEGKKPDSKNFEEIHKKLWQDYLEFIQEHIKIGPNERILDIGCGPWGLINYISEGDRYGLDPLMDYFLKEFDMPKDIKFLKGVAENLPFKDNFFDLVIATNVLNHTEQPLQVLNEIKRVLRADGFLLISCDCFGPIYRFYRILREKIGLKDPYHPFSFTSAQLKKLLLSNNFNLIDSRVNLKYNNPSWMADRPPKTFKGQIYNQTLFRIEKMIDKNLLPRSKKEVVFICKNIQSNDSC